MSGIVKVISMGCLQLQIHGEGQQQSGAYLGLKDPGVRGLIRLGAWADLNYQPTKSGEVDLGSEEMASNPVEVNHVRGPGGR